MEIHNFTTTSNKLLIEKIIKYAEKLEATQLVINNDYTISCYCSDGIICENYMVSLYEIMRL